MRTPVFCRKALTVIMLLAVCFTQAVPFVAVSVQGSSFDVLEFEKVYTFSLSFESCIAGELSSLGIADGGISASAASSGGERVSFSVTTGEDFDSSVIGKSGAVLELSLNIPDINGFLDSSGDFMGGDVILSVSGIEYQWALDDIGISQGKNVIRLNMRTASAVYPQTDIAEEEDIPEYSDGDEATGESLSSCVLTVSLKKLPSKEKASFILTEAAIEIPHVAVPDDDGTVLPSDSIGKTELIVALCLGVGLVVAIFIVSAVFVKKEQEKKRRQRRKKYSDPDN